MNNSSGRILPFTNTEIFSMVFTIFLWTAIILCLTLIPVHITEPQKDYETIHISLNSAPEKKVEEASLGKPIAKADKDEPGVPPVQKAVEQPKPAEPPKAAEAPKAVEQPKPAAKTVEQPKAVAKTEAKPAPKPAPKPEAPKAVEQPKQVAKTEPAPAPKTEPKPQQLVKSMEELMAEQSRAAPKKTIDDYDWDDWDDWDDSSTVSVSKTPSKNPVSNAPQQQSSLSGSSAASAGSSVNTNASAVSSSGSERDTGVSDTTLRQLAGMKSYSTESGGVTGTLSFNAAEVVGNGGKEYHIEMSGGSMRRLIYPASPELELGDTGKQIDSGKRVEIRFTVLAGGTVPYSSIKITPESILPPDVYRKIQEQISKWRFETAESDGQATFNYNIMRQ